MFFLRRRLRSAFSCMRYLSTLFISRIGIQYICKNCQQYVIKQYRVRALYIIYCIYCLYTRLGVVLVSAAIYLHSKYPYTAAPQKPKLKADADLSTSATTTATATPDTAKAGTASAAALHKKAE